MSFEKFDFVTVSNNYKKKEFLLFPEPTTTPFLKFDSEEYMNFNDCIGFICEKSGNVFGVHWLKIGKNRSRLKYAWWDERDLVLSEKLSDII